MTPFAFRIHTHEHGTSVAGYHCRGGTTTEIARGDPQKPQLFYPCLNKVTVRNGDYLGARCIFNTTTERNEVNIGIKIKYVICNMFLFFVNNIYIMISCL